MPTPVHEIFLASSFAEFSALRRCLRERIEGFPAIPLRAVAFDDGRPRSRPPLEHSLAAARRCDVMVLLVGEEYGGVPSQEERSYSHLEYRAALESDRQPAIRAWLTDPVTKRRPDPRLLDWRRELETHHTVGLLERDGDPGEAAERIFQEVLGALFDLLTTDERHRLAESEELGTFDREAMGPEELALLGYHRQAREAFGRGGAELSSPEEVLRNPARAACLEQREQAWQAMELGERPEEYAHFRRTAGRRFQQLVLDLERAGLRWSILSPTRPPDRSGDDQLVRLRPGDRFLELVQSPLPPDLLGVLELDPLDSPVEGEAPPYRLYRLQDGGRRAARWACYFGAPSSPDR